MYLSQKDKNKIVNFLEDQLNPKLIYLYGSFAKGQGRFDSDIDLAIYTKEKIDAYKLFLLSNDLAYELRRDVDIVDMKGLDTVFAAQIVAFREDLYIEDEFLASLYNTSTLKDYANLNEHRTVVFDAIKRDGSIYKKSRETNSIYLKDKLNRIEKSLIRIKSIYNTNSISTKNNIKYDSIVLNLIRSLEDTISISMHLIADKKLGLPQSIKDAFTIIYSNKIIDKETFDFLAEMISFKKLILSYQKISIDTLRLVISKSLKGYNNFIFDINQSTQ
jgi:uncharacterized protein YutE (UPF0331/DUF86 family)/predicted nucleotidyltransferase